MFEKEAEEWVKENMDCCKTDNSVNQSIPYFDEEERCCAKSAFQDGAEFGYNKAKAETTLLSQHILDLQKDKGNLTDEVRKLKLLVSSLVYEINQIWDINEMNDDLRRCAEKIDREVQLSKMAEDNRMVISALGFAIVPPKPKLDVKEV